MPSTAFVLTVCGLRLPSAASGPIEPSAVAEHFGQHQDSSADASKEAKDKGKEMDEQQAALRLAALAKAHALSEALPLADLPPDLEIGPPDAEAPSAVAGGATSGEQDAAREAFFSSVVQMKLWVGGEADVADDGEKDVLALTLARYECARARPGAALAILRKQMAKHHPASARAKEVAAETIALYRHLGLEAWATNVEELLVERFPVVGTPL